MAKIPTYEQFKKLFTNGVGQPCARFISIYGNVSFHQAYPIYVQSISEHFSNKEKIEAFENYLISIGAKMEQSNISESRYYYHNGVKYRFSNHTYPTGSMTSDFCVDLGAEPHLINAASI